MSVVKQKKQTPSSIESRQPTLSKKAITIANEKITAYDNTGNSYTFEVYPTGIIFRAVAGVYIFTKKSINPQGNSEYTHLYIGETSSFKNRPLNNGHEKWGDARKLGFNHICVHRTNSRKSIEKKLIKKYNPSLNKT